MSQDTETFDDNSDTEHPIPYDLPSPIFAALSVMQLPSEPGTYLIGGADQVARLFAARAKARPGYGPLRRTKSVTVQPQKKRDEKTGKEWWPKPYTFDYAPLEEVLDAALPALNAHGLDFFQAEADGVLQSFMTHADGAMLINVTPIMGAGRFRDIKDKGGAETYARRYAAGPILGLAPEDDDDGNAASGDEVQQQGPKGSVQKRREPPKVDKAPEPKADETPKPEPLPTSEDELGAVKEDIRKQLARLKVAGFFSEERDAAEWMPKHFAETCGDEAPFKGMGLQHAKEWLAALFQLANDAEGAQ